MATKNRGKGTRSTARRTSQPAATVRRAKGSAPAARKKTAARAKGNASAKRAAAASHELATLKREKITLEKRLTDTVREIAQLRHHEARVTHLERQLKELRDLADGVGQAFLQRDLLAFEGCELVARG